MITQTFYFLWGTFVATLWGLDYISFNSTLVALAVIIICQNFSRYTEEKWLRNG